MRSLHSSIADTIIVHLQHGHKYGLEGAGDGAAVQGTSGPGRYHGSPEAGSAIDRNESRAMAYTITSRPGFAPRLQQLRTAFADWSEQRRVYRNTLDELTQLNDRDLADLGLHRADLRRVAREAAGITG